MSETVVPIRSFDDKVNLLHRRLVAADDWLKSSEKKLGALQIAAGEALLEVRAAVESGEVGELADWWGWFEDNIRVISRRTAERYMQMAGAPEPEAKVVELRSKNTAQAQVYRSRLNQPKVPIASDQTQVSSTEPSKPVVRIPAAPKKYPSSPDDDRWIAQALDAWSHLSWDGKVRFQNEIVERFRKMHKGEE